MSELILPPHIELRQGLYFNIISQRWVGAYKIQKLCDDYWAESPDDMPVIEGAPGVLFYKKGMPVTDSVKKETAKVKYVKPTTLNDFELVIPPAVRYKEQVITELKPNDMNTSEPNTQQPATQKILRGPRGPYKTGPSNKASKKAPATKAAVIKSATLRIPNESANSLTIPAMWSELPTAHKYAMAIDELQAELDKHLKMISLLENAIAALKLV